MAILIIVLVAAAFITLCIGAWEAVSAFFGWIFGWLLVYLLVAAVIGLIAFTFFHPAQSLYIWVPLVVVLLGWAGVRAFLRNQAEALIEKVPAPVENYRDNPRPLGDYSSRIIALWRAGKRHQAVEEYLTVTEWLPYVSSKQEIAEYENLNIWVRLSLEENPLP